MTPILAHHALIHTPAFWLLLILGGVLAYGAFQKRASIKDSLRRLSLRSKTTQRSVPNELPEEPDIYEGPAHYKRAFWQNFNFLALRLDQICDLDDSEEQFRQFFETRRFNATREGRAIPIRFLVATDEQFHKIPPHVRAALMSDLRKSHAPFGNEDGIPVEVAAGGNGNGGTPLPRRTGRPPGSGKRARSDDATEDEGESL